MTFNAFEIEISFDLMFQIGTFSSFQKKCVLFSLNLWLNHKMYFITRLYFCVLKLV